MKSRAAPSTARAVAGEPLSVYRAKRDFSRTPEPAENGERSAAHLSYVIHKHWASHLHYDLRLELDGVMVSWAVPKGPSYDPKDKRMAVHVEDHPISYSSFEGTIPKRQYGGGKVIVWDKGHWRPLGDPAEDLRAGQLKFELLGHKLRGRWTLVRMKGKGEKHEPWLFIKEKDALAKPAAEFSVIDELPDSVASLELPAEAPTATAPSGRPLGKPSKLPAALAPQLATLVDRPPVDAADWLFEIKFDGYRLLARIDGSDIRLFTRNGLDWSAKLASLKDELRHAALPSGWYDGEIVVADEKGRPDFGALQRAFDGAATRDVDFHLFDLPHFEGRDLRDVPLQARREILASALAGLDSDRLRLSQAFEVPADQLVASACKLGLEGIIGKRRDSPYRSGRSAHWIKLKCARRQEFVVGGYTAPRGRRSGFGSLMLGVHDAEGVLQYAGNVGSGFDERMLADLQRRLDKLAAPSSPFVERVVPAGTPHWVSPTLVVEVSFAEWTRDGRVRHAVFRGMRSDKPAHEIKREEPREIDMAESTKSAKPRSPRPSTKESKAPVAASRGLSSKLKVSHGDRVIDAKSGTTKIDLVRYYDLVGALMKSHLAGRPTSVVRAPEGVEGELFFQKHMDTQKLPGLSASPCAGSAPGIEVATPAGLLSLAQWNVLELHTSNMRAAYCGTPDRMVFDLDPGEGVGWQQVQEAAQLVRAFLEELGLAAFLKTSGGKGLHLVVPIKPLIDFEPVKAFAHAIVTHVAQTIPQRFVAVSGPKNRVRKIFIDYLRNGEAATTVSAWSARARPGMGISVPVGWDELAQLRGGDHWTVRSVHERLGHGNEPWSGYARAARSLRLPMKKLGFVQEPEQK